ncbi:MAG TPA: hypothetical protein VJS38_05650 [Phenylobacterium sp.]|uniref:hypothetical protein n=1 Tax=Phenylobacterium sp. TaxID=1871053 RepID=UPI002B46AFCA|nr:hypothetical protein [Phenylobacterium sp.]HKR87641.1 hypothetical protein [Phenylobacterium sp.]
MSRFKWLVFTNCADGQDAEFNQWYDDIHLPDLLRIPGIVAASRARLSPDQLAVSDNGEMQLSGAEGIGARFRYLAIYEFETEDPAAVMGEVQRRANTPEMPLSPHLGEVYTVLYQA